MAYRSINEWLSLFLTQEQQIDLTHRCGQIKSGLMVDSLEEAIFYNFKYLYKPLSKKEFNKWDKICKNATKKENEVIKNEFSAWLKNLSQKEQDILVEVIFEAGLSKIINPIDNKKNIRQKPISNKKKSMS